MVPMFTMLSSWCVLGIIYITAMIRALSRIEVVFTAYPLTWFVSSVIFLVCFLKADWIHGLEHMEKKPLAPRR